MKKASWVMLCCISLFFFHQERKESEKPSFHKSDMFLERSPTDGTVGSVSGGSRKVLGQANSELRIIENLNHSVNLEMNKQNPSLQSIQNPYRSMNSIRQPQHAPSLQSMHSAQTSFDQHSCSQEHTRDPSPFMNASGRNGSSMTSLKQSLTQDDYSPQNTIRLRKISHACSNPTQTLPKCVNTSSSKPNTPTAELSTRQLIGNGSQQSVRAPSGSTSNSNIQSAFSPPVSQSTNCAGPGQSFHLSQQSLHQAAQTPPSQPVKQPALQSNQNQLSTQGQGVQHSPPPSWQPQSFSPPKGQNQFLASGQSVQPQQAGALQQSSQTGQKLPTPTQPNQTLPGKPVLSSSSSSSSSRVVQSQPNQTK